MKKWLTSLFLTMALVSALLAAMPLHQENSHMMKCCQKAKSKEQSREANLARLCCAINCTDPVPNAPCASFNFSPSIIIIRDSIIKQIASLLNKQKPNTTVTFSFERQPQKQRFQPKYIQHHSILI